MMDCSSVTTEALQQRYLNLVEDEHGLEQELAMVKSRRYNTESELLARGINMAMVRASGTTDDRLDWQEVGLR